MGLTTVYQTKKRKYQAEINLVPILDMLIVLIFFLILTGVFIIYSRIDTPAPIINSLNDLDQDDKLKLNFTVFIMDNELVLEGGFGKLYSATIPNLGPGMIDERTFKDKVVEVKRKFPNEDILILKPRGKIKYENIVKIMDISRELEEADEPIFSPDLNGTPRQIRELFPNVVFANVFTTDEEENKHAK